MPQQYSEQVFSLKQEIQRVFASAEHPGAAQNIRDVPCCPDHDANALWLSQHTWVEFQQELEKTGGDPFEYSTLLPKAYHYFIPAVLIFTLDNFELAPSVSSLGLIWDWPYVLIPIYGDEKYTHQSINSFKSQYLPQFTNDQRETIMRYLAFVCLVDREEDHISTIDVQRAIDDIWAI